MGYPNKNNNGNGFVNGDTVVRNGKTLVYNNGNWDERKKRSGAKEVRGVTKGGDDYFGISAWNANKKRGMISVSAFENSKSTRFKNKSGEESIMLMFEIMYKQTGAKVLEVAQYKFSTGKAFLSKIGMVISTKAPNGGYFGKMSSKN